MHTHHAVITTAGGVTVFNQSWQEIWKMCLWYFCHLF